MTHAELIAQIRFALSGLTERNAAHEFEEACRHLARQRIASNVIPATGPVGALGDQGRDIETFRSYVCKELGPNGAFLALVSDGPLAFACTIQQDDLKAKVLKDVSAIMAQGSTVARIVFFSVGAVAVGVRHALQKSVLADYGVELDIIDGAALAEQLADNDTYWIAEQYLRLPAEFAPTRPSDAEEGGPPSWYLADRARWQQRGHPEPTLGQLLDLRDGLRYAAENTDARADLPFWLALMTEFITDASEPVPDRARYEVAVAQIKGLGDLTPADEHVKVFVEHGIASADPARLEDCSVLLSFATTAFLTRHTQLNREQLVMWSGALRGRVRELLNQQPPPTARARLLEVLGNLCFAPDPSRVPRASEPLRLPELSELRDDRGLPRMPDGIDPQLAERELVDVDEGMRSWIALADTLSDTPLFPLGTLAHMLELLAPLLVEQPGWRHLTETVDAALARTRGNAAAAERSYGRAASLLRADRLLEAIAEIHRAKLAWWSGDHLRPSVLMLMLLGDCYSRLGLSVAAKQYYLGAASIALNTAADELADIVPHALLRASANEYAAGSWCSALDLALVGTITQQHFTDHTVDKWVEDDDKATFFTVGMTLRAAHALFGADAPLTTRVTETADQLGMLPMMEKLEKETEEWSAEKWLVMCHEQLLGGPFDDIGRERILQFAALGLHFNVRCDNEWAQVLAAERFAAAAQVLLVELAGFDLCLLPSGIDVRVRLAGTGEKCDIRNVSSNEGRRWEVTLTAYTPNEGMDVEAVSTELLAVLSAILFESSLLPADELMAAIESAFKAGLPHKLTAGRPYDELASIVDDKRFEQTPRRSDEPPASVSGRSVTEHELLAWQGAPWPTLPADEREELIANRYHRIPELMPRTLPRLRADRRFQTTVAVLRKRGWKDWHILTAAYNVLLQQRAARAGFQMEGPVPPDAEAVRKLAFTPETEDEPDASLGSFLNVRGLDEARKIAMLSLVTILKLEPHTERPDFPAIERFLDVRYGYWQDDVDHEDPFAPPKAVLQ